MQKQIDEFIQTLSSELHIESCAYNQNQILDLVESIKKQYPDAFIFEKNLKKTEHGEDSYSLIAFKKIIEIKHDHQHTTINTEQEQFSTQENPISILQKILQHFSNQNFKVKNRHCFFPFLIGQTSYDFISFAEPACVDIKRGKFPAIRASIYQYYLLFDHDNKTSSFVSVGTIEKLAELDFVVPAKCESRISPSGFPGRRDITQFLTDVPDSEFAAMIELAKKHIVDGDIFQIVLSRSFYYPLEHSGFYVYQALRDLADAPYLFYFEESGANYLGASPEKLVSVKNNLVEVCPLAGTRKRVHSPSEKFVEEELLTDEKEGAEHMMLVDLARNDVGSIVKPGSVVVTKLKQLKKYSHVMHLSSTVKGILKEKYTIFDALKSCFPAGTLTGAPKIRAVQLIDQIEKTNRNFYGGTIFLADLNQDMESCIAIRMIELANNQAKITTGAGIVFDSEVDKEILETKNKASLLLEAVILSKEYCYGVTD